MRDADLQAEALTLLHPLNVVLEAAHQLINKLVLRHVIGRVRSELFSFLLITRLHLLVDELGLRSHVLDPLRDDLALVRLQELLAELIGRESNALLCRPGRIISWGTEVDDLTPAQLANR